MAGVSGPLPYDIDTWAPVVHADPGATLTLTAATAAGAGSSGRSGGGDAVAPALTAGTAAGGRRAAGAGDACTLTLTAPAAAGQSLSDFRSRSGSPCLFSVTTSSGLGVKTSRLQGALQSLSLVAETASGFISFALVADGVEIALRRPLAAGGRSVGAPGTPAALGVSTGPGAGRHYEYVFLSPVHLDYRPLEPIYPGLLSFSVPYGLTVWRDAGGTWQSRYAPNPDRLLGATVVYEGGRLHWLTDDERAALTAGGFGDSIQLQEIIR